jgi:hypothetical protein
VRAGQGSSSLSHFLVNGSGHVPTGPCTIRGEPFHWPHVLHTFRSGAVALSKSSDSSFSVVACMHRVGYGADPSPTPSVTPRLRRLYSKASWPCTSSAGYLALGDFLQQLGGALLGLHRRPARVQGRLLREVRVHRIWEGVWIQLWLNREPLPITRKRREDMGILKQALACPLHKPGACGGWMEEFTCTFPRGPYLTR